MKNLILFFAFFILMGAEQGFAQKTTRIWLVRHAEKDTTNRQDRDPDLSDEGKKRAMDLAKYLKGEKIDSIFATNYKRTKLTGYPTADKIGLSIHTYNPQDQKDFAEGLLKNAVGEKILIIGHSDTLLPLLSAFGVESPLRELREADDYDYIFTLTIKGDKREVKVDHYGLPHHAER